MHDSAERMYLDQQVALITSPTRQRNDLQDLDNYKNPDHWESNNQAEKPSPPRRRRSSSNKNNPNNKTTPNTTQPAKTKKKKNTRKGRPTKLKTSDEWKDHWKTVSAPILSSLQQYSWHEEEGWVVKGYKVFTYEEMINVHKFRVAREQIEKLMQYHERLDSSRVQKTALYRAYKKHVQLDVQLKQRTCALYIFGLWYLREFFFQPPTAQQTSLKPEPRMLISLTDSTCGRKDITQLPKHASSELVAKAWAENLLVWLIFFSFTST